MFGELLCAIAMECASWAGRFCRKDVVDYSPDFHRMVNRALYGG